MRVATAGGGVAGMRIVVAGGGVAGAASAIALAQAGAEVTVYEAHEDPAGTVGSFLSLAVNGLRALEFLGCLPQVQAAGFAVARHRMWAGNGKLLGDVARGRRPGDPLHSVTLMRADLVTVLRDAAARAGATIITGQPLTGADLRGARAAGAGLVIGADGIWSAARRAVDPAALEPAYAGLYSVSGVSDGLDWAEPGTWNMILGRQGAFIYLPAPHGTIWWSAQVSAKVPPEDLAGVGLGRLATVFSREQRAVAILRGARTVHAATLHHVLAPVRRRHGSDIVLIGDAAHPAGPARAPPWPSRTRWSSPASSAARARPPTRWPASTPRAATGPARWPGSRPRTGTRRPPGRSRPGSATWSCRSCSAWLYPRATGWLYDYDPGADQPGGQLARPRGVA